MECPWALLKLSKCFEVEESYVFLLRWHNEALIREKLATSLLRWNNYCRCEYINILLKLKRKLFVPLT